MTDWAAALTYYGLLSLFPALIALVSILGLVADPVETTESITDIVTELGPETRRRHLPGPDRVDHLQPVRRRASCFIVGLATALWSASGYVGAFMRAANVIWETPEGRRFLKLRPLQLLVTLIMVLLLAFVALALVMTGPVVEAVGDSIGLGSTATDDLGHRQVAVPRRGPDPDDRRPLPRGAEREDARLQVGHGRQRRSPWSSGSSPRPPSPSTSPTSAPTTRPTARSAA